MIPSVNPQKPENVIAAGGRIILLFIGLAGANNYSPLQDKPEWPIRSSMPQGRKNLTR